MQQFDRGRKRPVTNIWVTFYSNASRRVCLALFGLSERHQVIGLENIYKLGPRTGDLHFLLSLTPTSVGISLLPFLRSLAAGVNPLAADDAAPQIPHAPKSAKSRGSKSPATALTPANRHRVERRHIPTERMEMPTIVDARTVRTALRRRSNQAWTNPRLCRRKGGRELVPGLPNVPSVMKQSPGKIESQTAIAPPLPRSDMTVIPGRTHPTTPLRPHCPTKDHSVVSR
ncbi:hypothetical protein DFH09DRAFT_1373255 [Mycena vulgaris]|nr:hypothetical protein DFH09DRAFT_1373255 [Mycena vulgaris]